MPKGQLCGNAVVAFSGEKCSPACAGDNSPSFNSPTSLSCSSGSWFPAASMTCEPNAVSGTLSVKIIKAYDLKDEDWWPNGVSDPYVHLALAGNNECNTPVLRENSNPEWTDPCKFSVSSRAHKLFLYIYDEDKAARDDRLGPQLSVDLREVIETGESKEYEFKLYGNGKLSVTLVYS